MSESEILVTGAQFAHYGFRPIGPVVEEIVAGSQREIMVLAYILTKSSLPFLEMLDESVRRGVHLTLVLGHPDSAPAAVRKVLTRWNECERCEVRFFDEMGLLHTKVLVSDRERAVVGSANFTWGGTVSNHEVGVLVSDRRQVWSLARMIDSVAQSL